MTDRSWRQVDHRPWPPPAQPWLFAMSWRDLLFAHWALPAATLDPFVPPGLALETFEGRAWVGITPFRMADLHPRGLPGVPGASAFPELNVRTYVSAEGKPGIFFFSLDAASRLAVIGARIGFHLPYFSARMRVRDDGTWIAYKCRRHGSAGEAGRFIGRYRPTGPVFRSAPGSLEHWLTERYCLYAVDRRGRIYRAEVHHAPWPLQPAEAEIAINSMAEADGFSLPATPPLLHFARRLDVVGWLPTRLR